MTKKKKKQTKKKNKTGSSSKKHYCNCNSACFFQITPQIKKVIFHTRLLVFWESERHLIIALTWSVFTGDSYKSRVRMGKVGFGKLCILLLLIQKITGHCVQITVKTYSTIPP